METTKNRLRWFLLIDWFVVLPLLVKRPYLGVLGAAGLALLARQERQAQDRRTIRRQAIPHG